MYSSAVRLGRPNDTRSPSCLPTHNAAKSFVAPLFMYLVTAPMARRTTRYVISTFLAAVRLDSLICGGIQGSNHKRKGDGRVGHASTTLHTCGGVTAPWWPSAKKRSTNCFRYSRSSRVPVRPALVQLLELTKSTTRRASSRLSVQRRKAMSSEARCSISTICAWISRHESRTSPWTTPGPSFNTRATSYFSHPSRSGDKSRPVARHTAAPRGDRL